MERRPMRYAHADGHTDIAYTGQDGSLVTCGSDGDVRVWAGLEDDDPRSVCVGEWALALSMARGRLLVATDAHRVQAYSFPALERDGVLARFTAPVTQIATNNNIMGCCSENMEARFHSLDEGAAAPVEPLKHEGPVLGLACCPRGRLALSSCGDGFYRAWDLSDGSLVKQIQGVPKVNSFYAANVLGRASFEPNSGKVVAYPNNKEISVMDTKTWQQKYSLTHTQVKNPFSQCLFSPCGNYLAGSTTIGQIIVWDINSMKAVGITDHPGTLNVCSMAWNPDGNGELAFCDVTGQLGTVVNCFGNAVIETVLEEDDNLDLVEMIERENNDSNDGILPVQDDSDDDNENAVSLNRLKNETLKGADLEVERPRSRSRSRSRSSTPERRRLAQPAFQPSATPQHLEHRYMCWNEVGAILCHTSDSESTIDVEFHDTATHHGIHITNHLNHTLAALSTSVLALACEAPSKLVCIALSGGSKEWTVALPDIEEVICLAATEALVAAATTARLLRLFTPLGTQLHAVCISGPPVCLVGRGGLLHLFYHAADPGCQDQQIAVDTFQLQGEKLRIINEGTRVPLSPGALLRWAGCSERGSAVTLDSSGVLRLHSRLQQAWLPICNTQDHTKGASDTFYVTSVNEEKECARVVLCRGAPFPPTVPRPTEMRLPFKLPFCETETEKSELEEELRRVAALHSGDDIKKRLEIILKLFALACRSEVEQRGSELVELCREPGALGPAVRYASRLGRRHLAEKLSELSRTWEDEPPAAEEPELSQDMFETQESDVSLVLPYNGHKEEIVPLKPPPIHRLSSQSARNPFRKSNDGPGSPRGEQSAPRAFPLSVKALEQARTHNQKQEATKANDMSLTILPSETFIQWFGRNKENLRADNADMSAGELTKLGMRTYKSLQPLAAEGGFKRKLAAEAEDDSKEKTQAPKQSKLSAFAFQKKTES